MSDWTQEVLAKKAKNDMKANVLELFDKAIAEGGCDRGEAMAICRGLVPKEIAYIGALVDHWIDQERPLPTTT